MTTRIITGDCRDVLPTLQAESFDCIVTSPPYWGLRDYGVAGQIGLERTLGAYVETMAAVGHELWRVLKPSGTFWLNIGDSYAGGGRGGNPAESIFRKQATNAGSLVARTPISATGLKPKDLCMIPARVALELQASGWWLRSEIIWAKPNPMPESVTDRPTSAHEKVWFLTKSERYWYDASAIAEQSIRAGDIPGGTKYLAPGMKLNPKHAGSPVAETRNARNVWQIASSPFSGSHFATMPPALAERCIKAGCPSGGHVLDPFSGAGTTALVADRLGRHCTGIELNPAYRELGAERVMSDGPLFAEVSP